MFAIPAFDQYRQEMIRAAHQNQPIPEQLQEIYKVLATQPYITHSELEDLLNKIGTVFYPGMSFNQLRKRAAAVLGYRSVGLFDKVRVVYTRQNGLEELSYPNLWHEFVKGYSHSIFGDPFYGESKFTVAYLELLYEPYLSHYLSSEQNAGELMVTLAQATEGQHSDLIAFFENQQFINGFYLYVDLAKDKTAAVPMLRDWVVLFQEVVGVNATEALNVAAMAMGYKSWSKALQEAVEDSVTNQRWQWAYA